MTSPLLFKRSLECFQKKRTLRWLVSKSSVFGAELDGRWGQNPVLLDMSEEGAWELLLAPGWSPCRLCSQWPGMPRADKKCQLSYRWPLHILTPGFLPERGMVTGGEVWGHLWGWINVWCLVFASAHKVCSLVFFRSRKTSERIWESTILVMCQLPNIYVY